MAMTGGIGRADQGRRWCGAVAAVACAVAGCHGGLHHRGERRATLIGSYAHPIGGNAVWPAAEGRADNAGVTLGYNHFLRDRFSLVGTMTPYRNYNQSDGDVYAGEIQFGLRYHFWETEVARVPVGFFVEALGGFTYGARSIPEEGSSFNFTQDSGIGFEVQLTDRISWVGGYRLKHLSNGNFFNDDNPSQNDNFMYMGLWLRL